MALLRNLSIPAVNLFDDVTPLPSSNEPISVEGDITSLSQFYIVMKCFMVIRMVVCFTGISANIINIRTFLRMGIDDSVTVAFFNLAISDLIFLLISLTHVISMVCEIMESDFLIIFKVRPMYISSICVVTGRAFSDVTMLLTAFLAVQRCLCVVRPLHFKGMFTMKRSLFILIMIFGFGFICGGVHVSQYQIVKITIPASNATTYIMLLGSIWSSMATFNRLGRGIILNFTCQGIVLLCLVALAFALKKSAKFRQATSAKSYGHELKEKQEPITNERDKPKDSDKLPSKEKQATVQVALVSVIFVITNSIPVITNIAELIVPELGPFRRYHYTLLSYYQVRLAAENVNSSMNFFVYYKFNTKFRQICFKSSST